MTLFVVIIAILVVLKNGIQAIVIHNHIDAVEARLKKLMENKP